MNRVQIISRGGGLLNRKIKLPVHRPLSYILPTQPNKSHLHPTHLPPSPATPTVQAYLDRADSYLLPVYARPEIVLAKSKGAYVWDVEGRRYLDFSAGIAVNSLGGGDGGVLKVGGQLCVLSYLSGAFGDISSTYCPLSQNLIS